MSEDFKNENNVYGALWNLTTTDIFCALKCSFDSKCWSYFLGPASNGEKICIGYTEGTDINIQLGQGVDWVFYPKVSCT